ncbi:hypothetical protein KM043_000626 [Ampulex compressa]|nr:hypothetical protein KM043_000626 [Ampulex compressa]
MDSSKSAFQDEKSGSEAIISIQHGRSRIASDFGASFVISGMLAASFKTMIAPFERIKLILQTQACSQRMTRSKRTTYSGFFDAIVRIPREQGFLSLWRGNFINICRYFPAQAINFSLYDVYYRAFLQPKTTRGRDYISFLAGGTVGVTSCILLYPLTFCTTRISVDMGNGRNVEREFRNFNDCVVKIFKSDGYRGFYQGLTCSAIGMFLYRLSTYFGVYTTGKRAYLNDYTFDPTSHIVNAPFLVSLALAQSASVISTFISYPLDTIARQKMLWSGRGPQNYTTIRETTRRIVQNEGPIGLYRGVLANLLTTVCGSFILATYDIVKGFYQRSRTVIVSYLVVLP